MSSKTKDKPETVVPAYDDDAAPAETAPAIASDNLAALSAQAADPTAEPTALDPGGDIATDWKTQVVGREIVITRWALAPVSEAYANANSYGLFAVIGFYFPADADHKPRFTTNGSQRIVETIYASLIDKTPLPVKATVITFATRGGFTGYRFLRPGEAVR